MHGARRLAWAASVGGAAAAAAVLLGGNGGALPYGRLMGPPVALAPGKSLLCPLQSKQWVNDDTVRLRFELPSPSHVLGLPVPGHLVAIDNAMIYRPYSPITVDSQAAGYFELLVRRYPGGELSSYLAHLEPGECVHFRGPVASRFEYSRGATKQLGFVAAGTGITPMWQVIQTVLADPDDRTSISLLYACRSADAILLRSELDDAAQRHPDRLSVCYVLSDSAVQRGGESDAPSRIDAPLLQNLMPAADAEGTQLVVCGPEGFVRKLCGARARDGGANSIAGVTLEPALGGMLKKLGYRDDQVAWL